MEPISKSNPRESSSQNNCNNFILENYKLYLNNLINSSAKKILKPEELIKRIPDFRTSNLGHLTVVAGKLENWSVTVLNVTMGLDRNIWLKMSAGSTWTLLTIRSGKTRIVRISSQNILKKHLRWKKMMNRSLDTLLAQLTEEQEEELRRNSKK